MAGFNASRPVLTKPPRTIAPNTEWETYILEEDAPTNSLTTIVDLTRVRLSGEHVLRAEARTNPPPAGHIPDGSASIASSRSSSELWAVSSSAP